MTMRLGKKDTLHKIKTGERFLMVTFDGNGKTFANGVGVSAKAGAELTAQGELFDTPCHSELKLQPREDGLFPGFSQTWGA